jgi:single-stranded DNA-binding protein
MSKATITIEGFVSSDPETRAAGNHRVTEVTVPYTPSKLVDGQWINEDEKTVWFVTSFWNELGDAVAGTVRKGSFVTITGTAGMEAFLRKDGSAGGKVTISKATIAVVVRSGARPARAQVSNSHVDEPWGSKVAAPPASTFPNDDTPF